MGKVRENTIYLVCCSSCRVMFYSVAIDHVQGNVTADVLYILYELVQIVHIPGIL
jgi:hypothetical protein